MTYFKKPRDRILDAAAKVFDEYGYSDATIDTIAECLIATKGFIYYHFRSKINIYLGVFEEGMRRTYAPVEAVFQNRDDPEAALVEMSTEHITVLMEHFSYHQAVHEGVRLRLSSRVTATDRDVLQQLNELRDSYEMLFRTVVEEGVAVGCFQIDDAAFFTRVLLSSLNGTDSWFRPELTKIGGIDREFAKRVATFVLYGLNVCR